MEDVVPQSFITGIKAVIAFDPPLLASGLGSFPSFCPLTLESRSFRSRSLLAFFFFFIGGVNAALPSSPVSAYAQLMDSLVCSGCSGA